MLAKKADTEITAEKGRTALFVAVLKNRQEVAKLLLAHGAKKDVTDKTGQTLFFHARLQLGAEAAKTLLGEEHPAASGSASAPQ